jgi:4-hydroxy-tetrahydrodipicolinate synthase
MTHQLAAGVIAGPILPFHDDGSIDWTTLSAYLQQIAEAHPTAIAMNMAISEVSSLEVEEQLEVLKRTKEVLDGSCTIISGVNVTHTKAAIDLGRRMVDAGAQGLVIFPPVPAFLNSVSIAMIEDFHSKIAEAVQIPLIAFQTNFISYPKGAITALSKIPGIVSIKDASFNVEHTQSNIKEAQSADRKIGILTGSDTFILEAMLMGCDGALIGFAATATAEIVRMQKLAKQGKVTEAYEIWNRLGPLARACWRTPLRDYRVRTKYVLMKQGVISNMKVRAPLSELTAIDRANIDLAFEQGNISDSRFRPGGASYNIELSVA